MHLCGCLIYTLQLFLCCGLCWLCRCGCYEDDVDYEEPPQQQQEVIIVDATGDDAALSQPLIVKDVEPSAPAAAEGGTTAEANAVAV